jgi:hypothetical protein
VRAALQSELIIGSFDKRLTAGGAFRPTVRSTSLQWSQPSPSLQPLLLLVFKDGDETEIGELGPP